VTTAAAAAGGGKEDEKPQGLLKVWRVPVQSEKGMGTAGVGVGVGGEDMAFWVSRRRFVVRPFSLPPVEGDLEAQEGGGGGAGGEGIDF
jgi:elongator complex protein 4